MCPRQLRDLSVPIFFFLISSFLPASCTKRMGKILQIPCSHWIYDMEGPFTFIDMFPAHVSFCPYWITRHAEGINVILFLAALSALEFLC